MLIGVCAIRWHARSTGGHLCRPTGANDAVLVGSEEMPPGSVTIEGYDFNNGVDYHAMFKSFFRTGYQATNFGKAVKVIDRSTCCTDGGGAHR